MTTDLTQGPPGRLLWKFSLPLLWSIIFQQLYNIADSVIAGQFVGESALARYWRVLSDTMIFIAIATGSNIGCSVVISQLFGAEGLQGDANRGLYLSDFYFGIKRFADCGRAAGL